MRQDSHPTAKTSVTLHWASIGKYGFMSGIGPKQCVSCNTKLQPRVEESVGRLLLCQVDNRSTVIFSTGQVDYVSASRVMFIDKSLFRRKYQHYTAIADVNYQHNYDSRRKITWLFRTHLPSGAAFATQSHCMLTRTPDGPAILSSMCYRSPLPKRHRY